MEKFKQLGISEHVLKSIEEQMFVDPTEIQDKAIPLILKGKDVIAGAATGSGKTLAFASGIIHNIEHGEGIKSLILTPTRELAEQVATEMIKFSKYKHLSVVKIYGGVAIVPQINNLKNADIVVGTPGRILDHAYRKTIQFEKINILVLDEADRMLDMGFRDDVEKIIKHCPQQRQTLLFSATISAGVVNLAQKYMIDPTEVSAESYVDCSKLEQVYYDIRDNLKFSLLVHFLKKETSELVMIFCNTKRNTDFVARNLRKNGIKVLAIHGGYSQPKRRRTMEAFNANKSDVLVCTDVAARGLDIKGVSHIYNYDISKDSNDYIHRIGRTARAGKEGKAISLLISKDYDNFNKIMKNDALIIKKGETPYVEQIPFKFDDRPRHRKGRFDGGGHGGKKRFGQDRSRGNREGHRRFGGQDKRDRGQRGASGDREGQRRFGQRRPSGDRGGQRRLGQNRSRGNREGQRSFGQRRPSGDREGQRNNGDHRKRSQNRPSRNFRRR